MAKHNNKDGASYNFLGSAHDLNMQFYERYDASFLFNKVLTLLYVIDHDDETTKQIQEYLETLGGGALSSKYLESLRAEVLFTTLHQCEAFFAMLLALFQPLPHWIYLTTYTTKEIKGNIEKLIKGNIGELTGSAITTLHDLVWVAVYSEIKASDPELASRWETNLDNAAWIIDRVADYFKAYEDAYNSYKHGMRVMTGAYRYGFAPQGWDGMVQGPLRVMHSSENSVTYLQRESAREVDGQQELPISSVTKTFSPREACFYMAKMHQMLETIKATRLARLKGEHEVPSINTFFGLEREEVIQAVERSETRIGPARADEGRAYQRYIEWMRAHAEQQAKAEGPDATNVESPPEARNEGSDGTLRNV